MTGGAPDPRLVRRCIGFVDLCGSTAFLEEHGPSETVAVLGVLRSGLRAGAPRHNVRIVKWLGDGAMLCGAELDELVACVREMIAVMEEDGRLRLRAGICTGAVVLFEGEDYLGSAVNVAARLCAAAEPGRVLVERASAARLPAARVVPVAARGFASAIAAVEAAVA